MILQRERRLYDNAASVGGQKFRIILTSVASYLGELAKYIAMPAKNWEQSAETPKIIETPRCGAQ